MSVKKTLNTQLCSFKLDDVREILEAAKFNSSNVLSDSDHENTLCLSHDPDSNTHYDTMLAYRGDFEKKINTELHLDNRKHAIHVSIELEVSFKETHTLFKISLKKVSRFEKLGRKDAFRIYAITLLGKPVTFDLFSNGSIQWV